MATIRSEKIPLHAILADPNVKPVFVSENEIHFILKNGYEFHKAQIEKNIQFIKDVIKRLTNIDIKIQVSFSNPDTKAINKKEEIKRDEPKEDKFIIEHRQLVQKALEIFNGRPI